MFALNGTEIAISILWLLGVIAAVLSWPRLGSVRHRVALLIAAVVLPVIGSLVALAVFAAVASGRRAHRADV